MGIFNILFGQSKNDNNMNFDEDEYTNYNNEKIDEFKRRYDLSTIEGIKAIPISEANRYPDGGKSVVYMPEQILNRQATEYKKENKFDLAIECLKKSNELYPHSFYTYHRHDYERLVDFMILAKQYDEAKKEHEKLNKIVGSRIDELKKLQQIVTSPETETKEEYYERVIKPSIEEERQREEYYWLLENFPSLAPKSFGGYRKMKNSNSSNYKKIIEELSKNGVDIDNISFWL